MTTNKKQNSFLLWLGMFGSLLLGHFLSGARLSILFQPKIALMVLGPWLVFTVFHQGIGGTITFFGRAVRNDLNENDAEFVDKSAAIGFIFGGLASMLGIIGTMSTLNNPDQLGMNMAVALVSMLYGAAPAALFLPLSNSRSSTESASPSKWKRAAGFSALTVLIGIVGFTVAMMALRG